jgi:coenzyme PQQ precursor peptide PqqA
MRQKDNTAKTGESMKQPRQRWERPDFEERPLGAEVTAYVTAPGPGI